MNIERVEKIIKNKDGTYYVEGLSGDCTIIIPRAEVLNCDDNGELCLIAKESDANAI